MIKINKIVAESDGSVTTTLIQEIPANNQDEIYILNPTVKVDMGNAESMDFSLQAGTPFYNSFSQMKTYIQVIYDGTTIFYGRVLTIDDGAFGTRKVHCEGALSFLNDSFFPPKPEKARDNISIYSHITEVLANHNSQLNDPLRAIYVGKVPGNYSGVSSEQKIDNESREFGSSSWTESKSMLEDLKSHYGGCFRIRYSSGKCYLDWMNHYFQSTVNSQAIEVGVNLIDLGSSTEVSNIFTAVIPIGKKEEAKEGEDKVYISYNGRNYMKVPEVANFYTDAQLNSGYHTASDYKNAVKKYGLIFKTVEIQEGTTPEILLNKTAKWIKENFQGSITSFSVKAIDMRMIGDNTQKILAGDRVLIRYITGTANKTRGKIVEDTITCTSVTYDLFNPENNQYNFGIPANSLSRNYSTKGNAKQKVSTASNPPSAAASFSDPAPTDPNEAWRQAVFAELKKHKVWYKSTGNQETGPEDRANVPNKQRIWHAHESMTNGKTNYEVWIPTPPTYITGQTVYVEKTRMWPRDGQGRPTGSWKVGTEEELTITYLRARFLFEYMKDEHGVDLTTDLSVQMPGTYTDEEGNTTLTTATPVLDPDTGQQVSTTMASYGSFNAETGVFEFTTPLEFGAYDPENGIWNFLGNNGTGYISQLVNGEYHYYQVDPNNPNRFIEVTNIRNLHISQVQTEDFIGTMTEGGLIEENGRINTYLFGQEILRNHYEGGDIVVAHVDGDMLMLGSENTMWSYHVASRINGSWVQPFYYVYNPDTGTGERVYINERAGTISYRGYYDSDPTSPTFGEFILQETGRTGPHGEPIISITGNGIWDDKTLALKGGIITGNIGTPEHPEYVSYVKSDRLVIGDATTDLKVMDALVSSGVISMNQAGKYSSNALVAQSVYAVDISGINGRFNNIETKYLKVASLSAAFSSLESVVFNNGGKITMGGEWFCSPAFDKITLPAGKVYFTSTAGEHQSATTFTSTPYDFLKEIRVTKINSYQYKLQYKKHGDSADANTGWHDIPDSTFSGASRLSGSWSGGIFTVRNDPDNQEAVIVPPGTLSTTALHFEAKNNPTVNTTTKKISQVYKVQWRDLKAEAARPGMGPQYSDTGFEDTITIDASSIYTFAHAEGFRKALKDKGITVSNTTISWPALKLATSGDITVSGNSVKQTVTVQYRDLIAEGAGQPAPYYTNSNISGTVTIDASSIYTKGYGVGYRKALKDKGITVSDATTSWPALKLATSGSVTVSGKSVKQTVTVQYRDLIAEGAGQPAPYYTNSSISGTVTISATNVYNNGVDSGYSSASGKVKVNGYSTVNTNHSIDPGGSCSITVPYYDSSSGNPKSTLTHVVTASTSGVRNTPHYNAIGDLNFLRAPDGTVQKLTMTYSYQGRTYTTGAHWWFYENGSFGSTYSGNLYTYYT